MSTEQMNDIVDERISMTVEQPCLFYSMPQAHANYLKACFDHSNRALLPRMKIWSLTGDKTVSFPIASYFFMQDDNIKRGGDHINFKLVHNVNHMVRCRLYLHARDAGN